MELYIIAGPNGAGKTTFASTFLPKYADCKNFVNADLIAEGISPFSPEAAAVRAGRLMLNEIEFFAQRRATFAFETTLSGRSYLKLIRRLKKQGYEVHFFSLSVKSVDVALSRVRQRVLKGGHDPKPWFGAGSAVRSATFSPSTANSLILGICLIIQAGRPGLLLLRERASLV
jgi:predicted ABC-type ATPase